MRILQSESAKDKLDRIQMMNYGSRARRGRREHSHASPNVFITHQRGMCCRKGYRYGMVCAWFPVYLPKCAQNDELIIGPTPCAPTNSRLEMCQQNKQHLVRKVAVSKCAALPPPPFHHHPSAYFSRERQFRAKHTNRAHCVYFPVVNRAATQTCAPAEHIYIAK